MTVPGIGPIISSAMVAAIGTGDSKGQKNDFNDAEAIAEAVQRPTMKFVATKTAEQLDLQALHRTRLAPLPISNRTIISSF
jgi:uncharacterized protein (DUF697 family)